MTEIHGKIKTTQKIGGSIKTSSAINGELDKNVKDRLYRDYNLLHNKPSIEDVELKGNKTLEDLGITRVLYDTVENWNAQTELIATEHTLYVYLDYDIDSDENYIPGFKLGDGKAYLIDIPFNDEKYYSHIRNTDIHITAEERQFWNDKVRVYVGDEDNQTLIFTTN